MGGRADDRVRESDALPVALREVLDPLVRDLDDGGLAHRVVDPRPRARPAAPA